MYRNIPGVFFHVLSGTRQSDILIAMISSLVQAFESIVRLASAVSKIRVAVGTAVWMRSFSVGCPGAEVTIAILRGMRWNRSDDALVLMMIGLRCDIRIGLIMSLAESSSCAVSDVMFRKKNFDLANLWTDSRSGLSSSSGYVGSVMSVVVRDGHKKVSTSKVLAICRSVLFSCFSGQLANSNFRKNLHGKYNPQIRLCYAFNASPRTNHTPQPTHVSVNNRPVGIYQLHHKSVQLVRLIL